jgi:chitodextrinase
VPEAIISDMGPRNASTLRWLVICLLALVLTAGAEAETITVSGRDSAAIAAAIAAARPGDRVYLAAGAYGVTETIKLASNLRLVGAGRDRTVLRFTGSAPGVLLDLSACKDVEVAHLALDGAGNPNVQQGIFAHNAQRLHVHHVTVRNLVKSQAFGPHGVLFSGTNHTREGGVTDSVVADCVIENIGVGAAFGAGIRLAWGSSRNRVLRNVIRNTGRGGIFGDNRSTNLIIQGNTVSGSGGEGLAIEVWGGCDRAVIEDNRIDHWLSIGGCDSCAVRRNRIRDHSGAVKFCGIEGIGSYLVVTDNVVDHGQQLGISVSGGPRNEYCWWARNTIRNCIQWAAQIQGDSDGAAYHYFYRCAFNATPVGCGNPPYPGSEGHGFRALAKVRDLVLEECEFRGNGRSGVQLVGDHVDRLSFVRCVIADNQGAAVVGADRTSTLEWVDCTAGRNGDDALPAGKPFARPAPTASFRAPAAAYVGEPVTFDSTSRPAQGRIAQVLWDFGDGAPQAKAGVTHVYGAPGVYRVTLVVWDSDGRAARAERKVRVMPAR